MDINAGVVRGLGVGRDLKTEAAGGRGTVGC
jgi:hypothetical protein